MQNRNSFTDLQTLIKDFFQKRKQSQLRLFENNFFKSSFFFLKIQNFCVTNQKFTLLNIQKNVNKSKPDENFNKTELKIEKIKIVTENSSKTTQKIHIYNIRTMQKYHF